MPGRIEARLKELAIDLPPATAPVANYVPYVVTGKLVFISGQISMAGSASYKGKVGQDLTVEQGAAAARTCALSILTHLKSACGGDLDRVRRCVKLNGFVNSGPEFHDHPKVINGASDLMVAIFGDAGRHARVALGAPALPINFAVEVDAVFEID